MLELFAVHLRREGQKFVAPRLRECSAFCDAEQVEQNFVSLVNEFDWLMSGYFMPDA